MTAHTPTITASSSGWLINCHCGLERYTDRRPAADRIAHDHRMTEKRKEK